MLGYYPSHGVWDGRYRSIKVTVNRSGARVLSRKGYLATLAPLADPVSSDQVLLTAMRSPFESTGIDLSKTDTGWEGAMDIAIAQRTAEGRTFKIFSARANLRFTPEQHDAVLRDGVAFSRVIVLRPDSRQLTVIVRDVPSGAIGSVIIPTTGLR